MLIKLLIIILNTNCCQITLWLVRFLLNSDEFLQRSGHVIMNHCYIMFSKCLQFGYKAENVQ